MYVYPMFHIFRSAWESHKPIIHFHSLEIHFFANKIIRKMAYFQILVILFVTTNQEMEIPKYSNMHYCLGRQIQNSRFIRLTADQLTDALRCHKLVE